MKKRIFVTGGEGFIGSCVIDRLSRLGHATASYDGHLNFIDNAPYYRRCLRLRKKIYEQPTKMYRGDIRNKSALTRAVRDFRPDVIVHLAGLPMARVMDKFAGEMIPINMSGTLNVCDVFERSKAEKLVYTSSSMAYGHFQQTPQPEGAILNPINAYGASKAAGEYFAKLSRKNWVIIRPTSVYGFTDCANRVSQLLIDAAFLQTQAWVIEGETLDFSYIDDVADGFVKAITLSQANGKIFNISAGVARSATEFAHIVAAHIPAFRFEVRKPTRQHVFRGPQDIHRARRVLHFKPRFTLEQGVGKILQYIEEYKFYQFS